MPAEHVTAAQTIADDVLFPAALDVDAADTIPQSHLAALAEAGLFGAFVPPELGGPGMEIGEIADAIEALASGCLATTFVWIQHFGLLGSVLADPAGPLAQRWLAPAVRGEIPGGIALAGLQPGPPQLRAEPDDDGWRLDGSSRWVTGWGIVDLMQVVARTDHDTVVTVILDATDQPCMTATRQHLVAVNASRTVQLDFDGLRVPAERVVGETPYDERNYLGPDRLRLNGSLALGVATRSARLMESAALIDDVDACRATLDTAEGDAMFDARAAASELAVRAATALATNTGSSAALAGGHAPRLMREALFLLVFGSRPGIKAALLRRLGV